MRNKNEHFFHKIMISKGLTLISQPYIKMLKIRPDFYCIEDQTYYEVISNRQAYHNRKEKMLKAKRLGINLRMVHPDGRIYKPRRVGRPKPNHPEETMATIKEYLEMKLPRKDISLLLNTDLKTINCWIKKIREKE